MFAARELTRLTKEHVAELRKITRGVGGHGVTNEIELESGNAGVPQRRKSVASYRMHGSPSNAVRIPIAAIAVALALVLSACGQGVAEPQQAQSPSAEAELALVGAKVYRSPTHPPLADGVVVIRNGRIADVGARNEVTVPPLARVLDCSGLILTSGFWNSHVHFIEPKWADAAAAPPNRLARQLTEMLTRYGFTTVVDTGSPWTEASALRRRVASGEIDGPRILSAGEILSAAGGLTPSVLQRLGALPGTAIEITSREQGIEQVRRHVSKGVDAVKIYAATTMQTAVEMPPDILAAVVREAHQNGKLALAHPHNLRGLQNAIAEASTCWCTPCPMPVP